jgi:hypothetical protein
MITKFVQYILENIEYNEELYKEGLKYFPKLHIEYIGTKSNPNVLENRYFLKKGKGGSFSENGFKNFLITVKIENIIKGLGKNIKNLNFSKLTMSCYFIFNNVKFRLSDHKKSLHDGIDILIKFNTDENEIITKILNDYAN